MADGPGRVAWYVAPTYRQARDDCWRTLRRLLAPVVARANESDLSVELINGGRIALRSADNYDALRGAGLDGVVLDEFADIDPEAWEAAIRPALSDRRGRALFIGTPRGRNHFWRLYVRARGGELGWAAWQYTTLEGGLVPAEEIEAARAELDERTFRQEYEASFESVADGLAYWAFSDENLGEPEYDPTKPLLWALDFNVDPMCSVIAQRAGDGLAVLQEIVLPNSSVPEACEVFIERAERYRQIYRARYGPTAGKLHVVVYGDAAGGARSFAGTSAWQLVRQTAAMVGDRYAFEFRVERSNPAVVDRVNAVNALLRNAAGQRRLVIHRACRELIADMREVEWKRDSAGVRVAQLDKSDPRRTHVSDALGYLVWREFGLRQQGGPRTTYLGV